MRVLIVTDEWESLRKSVTVVATADRKVIATISLHGKPEFAAVDSRGSIFVNVEDK